MRRINLVATLLFAVGVAFYFWLRVERPAERSHASSSAGPTPGAGSDKAQPSRGSGGGTAATVGAGVTGPAVTGPSREADFPIAARLNAPNANVARDLDIVQQLLDAWRSNFPHEGNPIGENVDITAALLGDNRLGLALVPKDHRALNSRGELCDRWGTPFRFHQLSGTKMEVRSAGPDRKFATDDDAVWTPQ